MQSTYNVNGSYTCNEITPRPVHRILPVNPCRSTERINPGQSINLVHPSHRMKPQLQNRLSAPAPFVACLLVVFLAAGCGSGPQVRYAAAPDVDLAATVQTFGFFPELSTDRAGFHTLVSRQLVSSTRREMEVRGFTYAEDPATADVLINFHTDVAESFRVRNTPSYWHGSTFWNHRRGFYDPWPGHRRWPTHSAVEVDQFTEGTLSIDMVAAGSNMLIWEGVATQRLTQRTLNDLGPALDKAVHEIFQRFPVPPRM